MSEAALDFWRGDFGDEYTKRNAPTDADNAARDILWREILGNLPTRPQSFLEIGANVGQNLEAIKRCCPFAPEFYATEPNAAARAELINRGIVYPENVTDGTADRTGFIAGSADLVFTSGVLVHVDPLLLGHCYREIYYLARRYIVSIEYFADEPEEKPYRGHAGKLFKRDFGKLWLEKFSDLKPIACGFMWKETTGLDNLTYWVFCK